MGILTFILVSYLLYCFTLMKLFSKAGLDPKTAWIPGYNFVLICRLIGRKDAHAWFLLFPIVNIFIFCAMNYDLVQSFGKYAFWQTALAVIFPPAIFWILGNDPKLQYIGPAYTRQREIHEQIKAAIQAKDEAKLRRIMASNPFTKSTVREWFESIVFAVFAAAFIRMFLIEAFMIPTSSMEGSLLVGDFLFVSKVNYGIRTPQTFVMLPLLHNRIPGLNAESYLRKPSFSYYRLPALEKVKRNDPVVFNYPDGDSIVIRPDRTYNYHDLKRLDRLLPNDQVITRPMDKKDHYIKRCIGMPGDTLQIRSRQVFIDGKALENPKEIQFWYVVTPGPDGINTNQFADWGISPEDVVNPSAPMILTLSEEQKQKVQSLSPDIRIEPFQRQAEYSNYLFPHDPVHIPNWTVDDFGPIYIPKKGTTIALSPENIAFYRRIIGVYENNRLEEKGSKIFINGQEATQYTFKMDYYWMMGDNRHNSEDSRVWGFVPEDHVVGKPLFIWFSLKNGSLRNGINWKRIFSSASKF